MIPTPGPTRQAVPRPTHEVVPRHAIDARNRKSMSRSAAGRLANVSDAWGEANMRIKLLERENEVLRRAATYLSQRIGPENEVVLDRRVWDAREDPWTALVTWIERTYHRRRRPAALGRLTQTRYRRNRDEMDNFVGPALLSLGNVAISVVAGFVAVFVKHRWDKQKDEADKGHEWRLKLREEFREACLYALNVQDELLYLWEELVERDRAVALTIIEPLVAEGEAEKRERLERRRTYMESAERQRALNKARAKMHELKRAADRLQILGSGAAYVFLSGWIDGQATELHWAGRTLQRRTPERGAITASMQRELDIRRQPHEDA